jgi:hypothetical protein
MRIDWIAISFIVVFGRMGFILFGLLSDIMEMFTAFSVGWEIRFVGIIG